MPLFFVQLDSRESRLGEKGGQGDPAPNPSPENKIIPRLACTHYHPHTKGENSKSAQLTCSVFVLKTLSSRVSPTFLLSYIRLFNLEFLWPGVRFMFLYRTLLKRRCIFYSKFYSKYSITKMQQTVGRL